MLLLLAKQPAIAQPLTIEWQNCFGGDLYDRMHYLIPTDDGYLLCGKWGDKDAWMIKTDLSGDLVWEKIFGGSGDEGAIKILSLNDGDFAVICGSNSSDGDIGEDPYPESLNYWIVRVNGFGDILWDSVFGGNCIDQVRGGTLTTDGNIVAFGFTCSDDGDISNYFGNWDIWMIKVDPEGNKIWDFTMGTFDSDISDAIIETSDLGFLISSGSIPTTGGNIECVPHNENAEIVLFKLDSVANIEWQQCYGGSDHESVLDMIEIEDGYLLANVGYTNDGDLTESGYHLGYDNFGNQTSDIWLLKLDITGEIVWSKCYGGTKNDAPRRVFQTEDDGFIVFGRTESFDGDVQGNHSNEPGWSDIWVIKISSNGDLIWQQCLGGNGNEIIESGVVDNGDGSYVIASQIFDFNSGQVACPNTNGSYQAWLIKVTDTTFLSVPENPFAGNAIKVYPNPAKEYVVFELAVGPRSIVSLPANAQSILITDIYGREIAQIPLIGDKTVWDTRGVAPGVYLYHFNDGGFIAKGKFMISK